MAANRIQLQNALHKTYDRVLFSREVLSPVFGSGFTLNSSLIPAGVIPNKSESAAIDKVWIYGNIQLDDSTEITCYEVLLQPKVRIEHSKVAIQQYIRKLLTAGQAALINFVAPANKNVWRLTLVAKDSVLTDKGVKEKTTNAKRYTFLLGPSETCKTAAERFEVLSTEREITFQTLVNAFSVEKLSKAFFDEYTLHYQNFCDYLQESNYRKSVFNITFPTGATKQEKDRASKPIRDFVKKLLGRIVFLYFVQKKGWLGASDTNYADGLGDFIKQLFNKSGGNDIFYSNWLTVLFFDTLNKERTNDDFKMPDGKTVKVPFLNGGLFDKEEFDEHLLTFPAKLFHHTDFEDTILTEKSKGNARGFLDFLDAFNFTVYEDSPDDHTVAVDPEMLGHIFENLLEDNKDKGAFYTPKEIVHYMCQESLTEYLTTHLSKEYTVYKEIGNAQVELFGNETKTGQLKIVEQLGDKALNRDEVDYIVKHKDISHLTKAQLKKIDSLLDTVKICDPAIGSGAFPMGLLQEIFSIKELIAYETGKDWKPAETKLNIIQNSIYGVDIEKGAVDIARLRFWLSLVVDEEKPKALPNLDYKIVVGDSLISKFDGEIVEIDWERKSSVGKADEYVKNVQRLLKEVADKQKQYFSPSNKNKKKLQAEIRNLKIELLINQLSFNKELYIGKTVQKGGFLPTAADIKHNTERELQIAGFNNLIAKLKNLLQHSDEPFNHFDWKLDFPEVLNPYLVNEKAGFDIVIGNPPYVEFKNLSKEIKPFLEKKYETAKGKYDLYIPFLELPNLILKKDGIQTFICPTRFMHRDYGSEIRKNIASKNKIVAIIDFADAQIFENVITYTGIFIFKKASIHEYRFNYKRFNSGDKIDVFDNLHFESLPSHLTSISTWYFNNEANNILSIIKENSEPLEKCVSGIYQGIATGKDSVFIIDEQVINQNKIERNILHKILKGKDISPYTINWSNKYLIYPYDNDGNVIPEKDLKDKFPNAYEYLISQKNELKGRSYFDKSKKFWYELWNQRNLKRFYQSKIITLDTAGKNSFAYDEGIYIGTTTVYSLIPSKKINTKALLAILNSKVLTYYHKKNTIPQAGGYYRYQALFIKDLPIKIPKPEISKLMDTIVSNILYLVVQLRTNTNDHFIPTYFEQIIDGMVYELYFPELLKKHNREIIQHLGELPEFTDSLSDEQKLKICKKVFERLNDKEHPVRVNLEKMKEEIQEIRIIEGLQ